MGDGGNSILEVTSMLSYFFLIHLQNSSYLCILPIIGFGHIEYYISFLGSFKEFLLIFIGKVFRHDAGFIYWDTTFFYLAVPIQFHQFSSHEVTIRIGLRLFHRSLSSAIHVNFCIDHFVSYFYIVIRNRILIVKGNGKLRSQSHFKVHFKIVTCFYIHFVGVGINGRSHQLQLLFLNIIIDAFWNQFLHFLSLYFQSVHLLDKPHRNHSWTESWHFCLFLYFFQRLLYVICIIGLCNFDGQCAVDFFFSCKYNIHILINVVNILYSASCLSSQEDWHKKTGAKLTLYSHLCSLSMHFPYMTDSYCLRRMMQRP